MCLCPVSISRIALHGGAWSWELLERERTTWWECQNVCADQWINGSCHGRWDGPGRIVGYYWSIRPFSVRDAVRALAVSVCQFSSCPVIWHSSFVSLPGHRVGPTWLVRVRTLPCGIGLATNDYSPPLNLNKYQSARKSDSLMQAYGHILASICFSGIPWRTTSSALIKGLRVPILKRLPVTSFCHSPKLQCKLPLFST